MQNLSSAGVATTGLPLQKYGFGAASVACFHQTIRNAYILADKILVLFIFEFANNQVPGASGRDCAHGILPLDTWKAAAL
ncbi:MAG: hypothetical protein R3E95_04730 [Thiolinea sp.]